jgi:hypothetical protein
MLYGALHSRCHSVSGRAKGDQNRVTNRHYGWIKGGRFDSQAVI